MEIRPVTRDRFDDLADLFGTASVTRNCWCMYFLVSGRERRESWGPGSRARFEAFADGRDPPAGLLAYRDGEPVGWCAMGPRSRYAGALRSRVLRERDPGEDDQVWLLPCFFVRREARRTGLTRGLLTAAVEYARRHGATAVEGFPLSAGTRRAPADAYLGAEPVFAACGFTPVARPTEGRVVMRRDL
jgi:GNAT superfamily N-acetyltransferase